MAAPLAPVTPAMAFQGSVQVIHAPVSCAIADEVPQLEASFPAGANVTSARAYFHSALGTEFSYVEGQRQGGRYVFNLPKPRLDAGTITYYIEFQPEGRTGEQSVAIVRQSSDCDDRRLAAIGPAPGTVFGPGGAIALPAGFGTAAAAGAAAATRGAGAASAAAGSTGISTGLMIAGAAVVAGAAVAVIATTDRPISASR